MTFLILAIKLHILLLNNYVTHITLDHDVKFRFPNLVFIIFCPIYFKNQFHKKKIASDWDKMKASYAFGGIFELPLPMLMPGIRSVVQKLRNK